MTEVIVTPEAPAELPPEILAAVAQAQSEQTAADVAIAEVHAEAATEQTAIIAEAQVAQAEIAAEVAASVTREELDECRRNSETALTLAQESHSLMQSILERLPPSPPNPNESPVSEEDAPLAVETPEAESPPEPVKKKPRINWT